MKRIPDRPLVTGKGLALAVDLGDASKADRRNPKCPSENAATIQNGGADPVNAPPLKFTDAYWMQFRSPEERSADEREDAEREAHESQLCNLVTCIFCIEDRAEDLKA